jgi:UDP-N-acetylmuramate dehydrogenase
MTAGSATALADELEARLPGAVEREVPLARFTTYRLGGPVAVLVRARRLADLVELAAVVVEHEPPVLLVGRGSNLLVADRGFPGVAVLLEDEFDGIDLGDAGSATSSTVRAGGAVALPQLARVSAAAGLGGLSSSSSGSRAASAARSA